MGGGEVRTRGTPGRSGQYVTYFLLDLSGDSLCRVLASFHFYFRPPKKTCLRAGKSRMVGIIHAVPTTEQGDGA